MPLITSAYGYILSISFFASLHAIYFRRELLGRAVSPHPRTIAASLAWLMLGNVGR